MARKNQLTTSNPLKYSEFERLLDALHKDKEYQWEMYARLSFSTACRASDVLQFRWVDILDKPNATVTEKKTGKTRKIVLNPSVQRKFRELYELMGRPDRYDYIMSGPHTKGEPMSIQYINAKLKTFKRHYRLDIDNFSTHTFRKTFGRYVYELHNRSAEGLVLLNKILNHSNIETTKAYIGITQDEVNDVFNSITF